MRERIRRLMAKPGSAGEAVGSRLSFKLSSTMQARGQTLTVDLDEHGISMALAARRILVGSLDAAPSFQEDQVQPSVGWPLVEMALQSGNSPVILRWVSAHQGLKRHLQPWPPAIKLAGSSSQLGGDACLDSSGR